MNKCNECIDFCIEQISLFKRDAEINYLLGLNGTEISVNSLVDAYVNYNIYLALKPILATYGKKDINGLDKLPENVHSAKLRLQKIADKISLTGRAEDAVKINLDEYTGQIYKVLDSLEFILHSNSEQCDNIHISENTEAI